MPASRSRRVAPRTPPSPPGPANRCCRTRSGRESRMTSCRTQHHRNISHADAQTTSTVPIGRPGPPHRVPVEDVAPVTPPAAAVTPASAVCRCPTGRASSAGRTQHPHRTAPPHTTPTPPLRGGAVFDRGPCPSQDPGPPPLPRPDPSGPCHPKGDPDLTPHGPGDSRSTGPGCLPCQGPTGRRTRGRERTDHGPAAQPGGSHAHHRTRTTNTRTGSGTRTGRHRVPVRGRVPHHRSTSAGRRRPPAASTTPGNAWPTC